MPGAPGSSGGVHIMSMDGSSRSRAGSQDVRRKTFNVRFRGLDHNEVRAFLRTLADDLERLDGQIVTLTQENERLRGELEESEARPQEEVTDHAVTLLNQAQQLADALIDEAMQSARDLLLTARSQQRDVIEQASTAAKGAVARATETIQRAGSDDPSFQDIEYIRMFAKVAQVQFRAVLDALNEQVNRLTDVPEIAEPPRPALDRDREPVADRVRG
jgi:DivIVA domain-containing protein